MSDTRAAIRELRSLSEKRSTQGLTEQERSRLAELRERLGLPSEPAEVRAGGPQPGGTGLPSAVPPAAPLRPAPAVADSGAPVAAAALPRLTPAPPQATPAVAGASGWLDAGQTAGTGPQPVDLLAEPFPAIEPAPAGAAEFLAEPVPAIEPAPPEAMELLAEPLQAIEPAPPIDLAAEGAASELEALQAIEPAPPIDLAAEGTASELEAPSASDATTDPAIELRAFAEASAVPAAERLAEPLLDLVSSTTLPDLEAQGALPELEPTTAAVEPIASETVLDPLQSEMTGTDSALEPVATELAPEAPLPPEDTFPWTDEAPPPEPAASGLEALGVAGEVPGPEEVPAEVPRRPSLAERIDAAVEAGESPEAAEGDTAEAAAWGAVPLAPEPLVPEPPLVPEDLGAIPLDVADPSGEFGLAREATPIELSSADVILLETEAAMEVELGGQPADRVPLAELHEFVGEQPADPRALAFDEQGEEPTFAPEDLQATEAELAAEPQAFHQAPLEELPELQPEPPPPAAAAPRIVVPRPPAAPPPSRPAVATAPAPRPLAAVPSPEAAVAPAPARAPLPAAAAAASPGGRPAGGPAVTGGTRAPGSPPPPPAGYVMGEDGRRLPALSAARPEPPQLAHQFGHSGPFVRNRAVLLEQAPLDIMEEADGVLPEPPPPPPPPTTDVATGAEVFGGTYLSPTFVEGEHRVVLHTLEGQVRRGTVKDLDLLDPVIRLAQPGRAPEAIAADRVKAIFFMQEPGTPPPPSNGRRIRVGFADGRQIVGFSEDVEGGEQGFFLVPADARTHTARIYVFRAGIQSISAA